MRKEFGKHQALFVFAAIPNLKLSRRQRYQYLNAKAQGLFGLAVAPLGIPADSVEERSKTWRLGGFALSSLVSDLELLLFSATISRLGGTMIE